MKIESEEFENNDYIPSQYTCDGENVNPPLEFCDVPENAKSLALIVDDPDAPNGGWVHWTVWNMSPETRDIDSGNSIPLNSVCGLTDFGTKGYGGPCPPSGEHRYFFKLYALDKNLDIDENSIKEDIEKAMEWHVLAQATLIGLYKKNGNK